MEIKSEPKNKNEYYNILGYNSVCGWLGNYPKQRMQAAETDEMCIRDRHYVKSDEQVADILTKALSKPKFVYLRSKLGLKSKNEFF